MTADKLSRTLTTRFKTPRDRFRVTRPLPIVLQLGFWLLIAQIAASIVGSIASAAQYGWPPTLAGRPPIGAGVSTAAAVFLLLILVFHTALALLVRRGVNWARILVTMFCALNVVMTVGQLDLLIQIENVAHVAAVVLIWLPRSNEFFRQIKKDREAHRSLQFS
ncbi:hypothetical protein [Microterricola viridarii]|uniref:Uncharacterized protein n=1 Tax=Microterricola viridarii TaxID=412690 RepID=A0A0X8E277_9MICO|nr:hypothetical protein [Microterricola viridarii]AMB58688.1 hypothetical protein AWU67_07220 [Microterricola viridarii]